MIPLVATRSPLLEVASLFLRLGFTAFGGPAAHVAMMREEVVQRRQWLSDAQFLDLMGVTNLIPGPNSTELAIYLGYLRAGWRGLLVAGLCFIGPAVAIVMTLAWAYVTYGGLPETGWLFYGIRPVVVGVVAQALFRLGSTVLRKWQVWVVATAVLALDLLGTSPLRLLLGSGLLFAAGHIIQRARSGARLLEGLVPLSGLPASARHMLSQRDGLLGLLTRGGAGIGMGAGAAGAAAATGAVPFSLLTLFLTFLKIGAVLYGSGYVLLAFLRSDFVLGLGWLSDRQLLETVSIGQFTPGPVFTTATFIGYLVGGWPGALLATLGIFLPSFLFVALLQRVAGRLRKAPLTAPLLEGVNIASLALLAGALLQLGHGALVDGVAGALTLGAFVLLVRFRINSVWLILIGAAVGVLRFLV